MPESGKPTALDQINDAGQGAAGTVIIPAQQPANAITVLDRETMELLDGALAENTFEGELSFSRLGIAQPLTPEVGAQESGWSAGQLFDNVTREIYSDKDYPPWLVEKGVDKDAMSKVHFCLFLPIFKLPTEFILWKDRKTEGNGFHWKTLDRSDPRVVEGVWPRDGGTWGTRKEQQKPDGKSLPPPVTTNANYLGVVLDWRDGLAKSSPLVATFSRTSASAGSKLSNFLQRHRMQQLPIFGKTYWFTTRAKPHAETNSTYHVLNVLPGRKTVDVNAEMLKLSLPIARKLADPKTGRDFQERIINAAALDQSEDAVDESQLGSGGSGDSELNEKPNF